MPWVNLGVFLFFLPWIFFIFR